MAHAHEEGSDAVMMSCEVKELGPVSEIMSLLDCPICKGVPIPPIWNCVNGHIACDQCHSQLSECGLCRGDFDGGRNLFMEEVINNCTITCPYAEAGCLSLFKTSFMKTHAAECKFGPQIKWMACQQGHFPPNAVQGGLEHGVKLFVIRARHMGSNTPGKMFEYYPPGASPDVVSNASLAWGGGEHFKVLYEVLVAPAERVKWIPSENGVQVKNAVIGGTTEVTGETLYIGRFSHRGHLINGKIHPSHHCCYIGVEGREIASTSYEILVKVDLPKSDKDEGEPNKSESGRSDDNNSMYS